MILSILILPPSQVHAATLESKPVVDPPIIDGNYNVIEWFWANHYQLVALDSMGGPSTITVDIWLMNNDDNIYVCVQWPDTSVTFWDGFGLFFDEGNSGNWHVDLNNAYMWTWYDPFGNWWFDAYFNSSELGNISIDTGSQDGQINCSHDAVGWTLELRVPLAVASAEDLNVIAGDTIGIALFIDRVSSKFEYPAGGSPFGNGSSVSLSLSSMSVFRIGIQYTYVLVIFSIAILAVIVMHRKRSKIILPGSRF